MYLCSRQADSAIMYVDTFENLEMRVAGYVRRRQFELRKDDGVLTKQKKMDGTLSAAPSHNNNGIKCILGSRRESK